MKKQFIVIETTVPSIELAKIIANILLENHLVGCIQISSIDSFYHWNNKINNDQEILVKIKTKSRHFKKICEIIKQNHPYQIPQIFSYKIENLEQKYQSWLDLQLK